MFAFVAFAVIVVALVCRKPNAGRTRRAPQAPGTAAAGVMLFEKPDTWSTVLCELPADAVVSYVATDGRFLRVTTADNMVGYVVASACTPETGAPSPSSR